MNFNYKFYFYRVQRYCFFLKYARIGIRRIYFFTEKSNENLYIQKKSRTFANKIDKKSIKIIKTLQIIQFIHN